MAESFIHIQNLHKSFGSQNVLKGVNLTINKGESIVIIGQSGCGKSVLLKLLVGLIEPDKGEVIFDGEDITKMNFSQLSKVRKRFGVLFQSAALFDSMKVSENVGLGLKESREFDKDVIDKLVKEKLSLVNLEKAYDMMPSELSGGMKKRVGLARAIAHKPEVLLYDEPTTGLDPITADIIDNLIVDLDKKLNVTSIAVTHDMKSAFKIADRIVMLHKGKVEFDGTPDEIEKTNNEIVRQFITGSAIGPITE